VDPHVPSVLTFRDGVGDDDGDVLVWEEVGLFDVVIVEMPVGEDLVDVVVVEMLVIDEDDLFAFPMA
jgi:hypothetical protein